jgi:hypothetical protein
MDKCGEQIERFRILESMDECNKLDAAEKVELWTLPGKINSSLWRIFAPDFRAFPELEYLYNR